MKEHTRGVLLALLTAVLWSAGGLGIKLVHAPSLTKAGFRCLFALPIVFGALYFNARSDRGAVRGALLRPRLWLAACSYAAAVTLFVVANDLTTAANAILLQYTSPIWVALLSSAVLQERVTWRDWLAIAGCLLGMLFFFGGIDTRGALGNAAAIASGVGFGLLTLLLRREKLDVPDQRGSTPGGLLVVALGNALGAVITLPFLASGAPSNPLELGVLMALGAVQIGLAYVLFVGATSRLGALEVTLITMLEPILNPLWVALGKGEVPAPGAFVGGALILASVTLRGLFPGAPRAAPRATG